MLIALIVVIVLFLLRGPDRSLMKKESQIDRAQNIPLDYLHSIDTDEQERISKQDTFSLKNPDYAYTRAWLVQKDGPEIGKKFPIYWDEVTLGRDEQNTIVIKDTAVSPSHSKIKRIKDTYMLFDLVSDNGTFLNGNKLLRPKGLYDWDEIKIGRTLFLFRGSKSNS